MNTDLKLNISTKAFEKVDPKLTQAQRMHIEEPISVQSSSVSYYLNSLPTIYANNTNK